MHYPQKPTIHPETGPTAPGVRVDRRGGITSGVIIFNQRPLQPQMGAIDEAITKGDTVEKRVVQLIACFDLDNAA